MTDAPARREDPMGKMSCCLAMAACLLADAASAAVICQKGARVKLRADACKPGWTQLATVGGGGDPSGTWEFTAGGPFDATRLTPRYLVLEPSGTGRMNLVGSAGGVLTCGTFTYARAETPTLTLDLRSIGYLDTRVMHYTLDGSDALALADADGRTAQLVRADAVPIASDCAALTEITLFTGLPIPEYWSGLAFDGASLWYEVQNVSEIVPVDPATGIAGTQKPFGAGQLSHPHAASGADFWTHCACGGSQEAGLVSGANVLLDEVETGPELGEELGVRAIAFDAASGRLWLHGYTNAGGRKLLEVDPTGAEPDDLVSAFDLDADLTGLAFDGTSLWGLHHSGRSLVRIDPATGTATGNFKIPSAAADWRGVAVVGAELVLLGDTGLEGALLKVVLPAL
jgi:hypothetical protein